MRKKWKRLPLPQEISVQLADKNIPEVDRVALANICRAKYDYPIADMAALIEVNYAAYHKLSTLAASNHAALIDEVRKGNCSIRAALGFVKNDVQQDSPRWKSCFRYMWIGRIEQLSNVDILFESKNNILYRTAGELFLGVVCGKSEKLCALSDEPVIVDTIMGLFLQGAEIRWKKDDFVVHGDGKYYGKLKHHIISSITNRSWEEVAKATVSYKLEPYGNVYNLKIQNLVCSLLERSNHPEACSRFVITRKGKNEINVINKRRNIVYITDFHPWLYNLLIEKQNALRIEGKDNRLRVLVGDRFEYIYHVVMAVHLYGTPTNEEDLAEKISLLRKEFLSLKNIVDHIDADVRNNRLSNLIMMSIAQNSSKSNVQLDIRNLGHPFFCWAERYDDTSVVAKMGYIDPLRLPFYMIHGVFSIEEFLEAMKEFVASVKGDAVIFRKFDEFDKKEIHDE